MIHGRSTWPTDPNPTDELTFEWDLDDDGAFDDATGPSPTFTAVGQDGVFPVCLRVTDGAGATDVDCTTVTVTNVAPSLVGLSEDSPHSENSAVTVSGTVVDPGWEDPLTATIDWGDGTPVESVGGTLENERPDATLVFSASHVFGDDGILAVEVCGTDDDTQTCETLPVTYTNVDPTAEIDLSGATVVNGVPAILGAPATRSPSRGEPPTPAPTTSRSCGTSTMGTPIVTVISLVNPPNPDPPASPSVQPRDLTDVQVHTFAEACVYEPTLSVVDDDGGTVRRTPPF